MRRRRIRSTLWSRNYGRQTRNWSLKSSAARSGKHKYVSRLKKGITLLGYTLFMVVFVRRFWWRSKMEGIYFPSARLCSLLFHLKTEIKQQQQNSFHVQKKYIKGNVKGLATPSISHISNYHFIVKKNCSSFTLVTDLFRTEFLFCMSIKSHSKLSLSLFLFIKASW